jgi:hypothetical protein
MADAWKAFKAYKETQLDTGQRGRRRQYIQSSSCVH